MSLSPNLVVRLFTPADLAPCAAVERAVYGSATFRPIFFRQLHDLAPSMQWVAADGAKVVGHVCGAIAQGGEVGWILNLAVLAHYRRQGIGERLLRTEVEALSQIRVRVIKAAAEGENNAVMKLYEKLGFRQAGVEPNYYGDGLDSAIFEFYPQGA